nr:ankyrin repeat domain-containing protein [Stenotrophomonas pictorum]
MAADIPQKTPFTDPAVKPLADAIADGDIARIKALAPTTDLAARGQYNVTLLEWAIWNQKPASLEALLEAGADPSLIGMDDETVVHMAAMVDPPEYLEVLLKHKVPVDYTRPTNGWTPLFVAVMYDQHIQRDLLINAGADIKRRDNLGNTLLHIGAKDPDTVLKLLEAGVDPTLRNNNGDTFQLSFFRTPEKLLNAKGKAGREHVRGWLEQHNIAIEH